MTFRKLLAGVAAAATLLSGMAFGAGSAMADEVKPATITLNGEKTGAVKGHTYKAVRIGSYDHASFVEKDDVTYVESLTVNTEAAVATGATTALNAAVAEGTIWNTGDYQNNPVGYVASESGYFTSSPNKPWSGNLRNFVSSLVRQADFQAALATATPRVAFSSSQVNSGASPLRMALMPAPRSEVSFGSNAKNVDHTQTDSIPMLVGTKVSGKDFEGQTLGVVNVKNQTTYINKVIVKNNQEWVGTTERVGDTVTFKLTSQVPLTVGYLNTAEKPYRFFIGDTMSKGLTFQEVTSVTIGNKTLTKADDGATATADQYQLTTTANQKYDESDKDSKATVLKFDLSNAVYAAGQNASDSEATAKAEDTITVVYTAILNKDAVHAVNGANPNKVTLDYTHNPDDNTEHHVPGPEVKVYTYDFGFLKVKADGQTSLDGAKFVIKQGDQYFRFNTTTGLWENGTKGADPEDADKFTGTNGVFEFKGLAEGTYDVVETDAPAGYLSTTKAEFQVVITSTDKDEDGNVLGTGHKIEFVNGNIGFNLLTNLKADGTAAEGGAKVKNLKSITQLPLTGAAGTTLFTVVALLVAGAGVTIAIKSRQNAEA